MYITSVPISISSIRDTESERDLNRYLDYFKAGNITRVFVCCVGPTYSKRCELIAQYDKFKKVVDFFKNNRMEVGIWLGGLGHGVWLKHEEENDLRGCYQVQTSVTGEEHDLAYCPDDENFADDYMEVVRLAATLNPHIIMVDDDFRLNGRFQHYMGCFCPKHLAEFYRLVGEEIPRDKIEELVFTGGRNKYRDAYMTMCKNTLIGFAKRFRATIDEVNPKIRAGACSAPSNWDLTGTDMIEISKAFAGDTKPFLRTFAAPYCYHPIDAVEYTRMQMDWVKSIDDDIEVFSEGDVYPRPRYNVPSKTLELFDLALFCDDNSDGILKYMFDYDLPVGYEEGYIEKHTKNLDIQKQVKELFDGKKSDGVRVFSAVHRIRERVFPTPLKEKIVRHLENGAKSYANDILPKNGIPVCYGETKYPVGCFGESARQIPIELLSNGAILDSVAAMILKGRGIDTGIIEINPLTDVQGEYYIKNGAAIKNFDISINAMTCDDKAEVLTQLLPAKTPGAYTYENSDGIRFFVLAGDFQFSEDSVNYYNNYYRQEQVRDAIEWIGRKKLPAVCLKNPDLYIMTATNDNSMSVLLINAFMDEIDNPVITLDREYKNIRFVNCDGKLAGDKVYLSELTPYGFAAFEVK